MSNANTVDNADTEGNKSVLLDETGRRESSITDLVTEFSSL